MSRYIAVIPVNGKIPCVAEQGPSLGLLATPVSNAIIAKLGAAARRRKFDRLKERSWRPML
jgi:hypothetical protein